MEPFGKDYGILRRKKGILPRKTKKAGLKARLFNEMIDMLTDW
jgi:hypothetical protein